MVRKRENAADYRVNTLRKNKDDAEGRAYWEYIEQTAAEVRGWPSWKRGVSEPASTPDEASN